VLGFRPPENGFCYALSTRQLMLPITAQGDEMLSPLQLAIIFTSPMVKLGFETSMLLLLTWGWIDKMDETNKRLCYFGTLPPWTIIPLLDSAAHGATSRVQKIKNIVKDDQKRSRARDDSVPGVDQWVGALGAEGVVSFLRDCIRYTTGLSGLLQYRLVAGKKKKEKKQHCDLIICPIEPSESVLKHERYCVDKAELSTVWSKQRAPLVDTFVR
jgi:hypothetical protein